DVSDTGIGIPENELPRLFERFHRVPGARGRTYEGSGIGLSLVQELVHLHGGTLRVASVEGQGSCFTVSIPAGFVHLPPNQIDATQTLTSTATQVAAYVEEALRWLPEEEGENGRGGEGERGRAIENSPHHLITSSPRILLVDDNADMRDYVRRLLSREYEVEAVSDGLAALDAVQRYLPDLVLTDVMMPGMNGLELLRSLRNDPATQNIPIILLSARAGEKSRIEGLEAGADDYLIKPFCARELLARVRTNLELVQLRQETVRYQEQLRVEAQAAQSQVSNILESITDAFVAFDREWRYTYVNEYATQLLRKKRNELLGKQVWTEVFPELVGTESYQEYHRAIAEQVPIVFEKYSQPMGVWVEVNAYPSPDGLAVYFRDITHRKQAEQALRESEERFRQLAENIDTVFFMSEGFNEASPGRVIYVSPAYERIWGRSCESLYQNTRSWLEAIHPGDRERVGQALPGIARAEFDVEFRIVRPDGEIRWVRDRIFPVHNERGELYRTAGIVEDITNRKQIEAALQQKEAQLRVITDTVPVLISFVDAQQRYRFNNRTYEEWFGHPATKVYGKHIRDVLGEPAYEAVLPYVEQVLAGQQMTFESEIPYKDGGIRYVSATYVPRFNRQGNVEGFVGLVNDISERKQAEIALQKSEERLRLAQLAAGAGLWDWDIVADRVTWSEEYYQLYGLNSATTPSYENWIASIWEPDREQVKQTAREALERRTNVNVEFRVIHPIQGLRWLVAIGQTFYDTNGKPIRMTGIALDITDRKQAEVALRQSEEQARLAIQVGRLGTWRYNLHTDFVELDKRMQEIWGEPDDAQTIPLPRAIERIHPDDRERAAIAIGAALDPSSSGTYEIEYRIVWDDGTPRWVSVNGQVQFEGEGELRQPIDFFGTALDITDRKLAEVALRESESRFRNIADHSPIMIWMSAPEGAGVWFNQQWCEFTGQTLEEALGSGWLAAVHPEDAQSLETTCLQAHQRHEPVRLEYRLRRQDGEYRWVFDSAVARFDGTGVYLGYIGSIIDITERKQAEEALRNSAERLSLALAAAKLGDWSWNAATDLMTFSERAAEIFGIVPDSSITWTQLRNLLHEEDRDRARLQVEIAIAQRSDYDIEYRVIHPDQTERWVAAKGRVQYAPSEQVLGMLGVVQDISDRKQVEAEREKLLAQEQQYANKLRGLTQAALAINSALSIDKMLDVITQQASVIIGAHQSVTSITIDQNWSQAINSVYLSEKYAQWRDYDEPTDGSGIYTMICQMNRPIRMTQAELEAHPRWRGFGKEAQKHLPMRGWLAIPLVGRDGRNIGLIQLSDKYEGEFTEEDEAILAQLAQMAAVAIENARLHEAQQQARAAAESAREEAETANRLKDEFLAVLSHELRSPLNPILGWAKLLQSRPLDEQQTKHALATIERNALLQTQLIEDLLDVSRILQGKLVLRASPVSLVSTIEAALETVRLAADAKGIQIQRVFDPNVGQVMGESARLQQVIWNLLSNAVKFTPSGGTIEIRLEQINSYAQLQVQDTGKGITREFLPYVFEYFRQEDGTTTRKFGGLGLGLAIVLHLVELHGGTVWAKSPGEGLGATFTVRLPLMSVPTQTPQGNSPEPSIAHLSGLQILVVDDELDIRDIVAFIVEQAGAAVSVAASAPEALNLIEQSLPDVLICDIGMPDMDGYMLMRLLRTLPPSQGGKIPAIALTAYAGEYNQKQALTAGFQQHIAKPVDPDELVRAIACLVQPPRST
ncbi:MAG TPA: PAS domain S-box protein, partial [Waterburya sp.]